MPDLDITDVIFVAGSPADLESGLVGYTSCVLGGTLVADGWTVRRTKGGELRVSFPVRTDPRGRRHELLRPLNGAARRKIEARLLAMIAPQVAKALAQVPRSTP